MSSERKKQLKREKREKKRKNATRQLRAQKSAGQVKKARPQDVLRILKESFADVNAEVIQLAASNASAKEIAEATGILESEADRIIGDFLKLPDKIVELLAMYPGVLQNPATLDAILSGIAKKNG